MGAEDGGTLKQRDTYFEVRTGRLKLREEPDSIAQLVAYERSDLIGHKESAYRLIPVSEPTELKAALTGALGIKVVVNKTRRLFIFEGVRIHLDNVENLGEFIEFEGVMSDGVEPSEFEELLGNLRNDFGISDEDLRRGSYSDLLCCSEAR